VESDYTLPYLHWFLEEQTPHSVTADIILELVVVKRRESSLWNQCFGSLPSLLEKEGKICSSAISVITWLLGVILPLRDGSTTPNDFFYLNNGYRCCSKIINAPGHQKRCSSVQRTFPSSRGADSSAIANAAIAGTISPNAKLLITLIEIGTGNGDIGRKITAARNVKTSAGPPFAALDPNQESVAERVENVGMIHYRHRRSAD